MIEVKSSEVLIVAAEASSDLYACRLMEEVTRRGLPLKFFGIGSERMKSLGCEIIVVAVAGATGNVGHEMLDILAERRFPAAEVVALASPASIGREVSFGDKTLKCKALEHYDFSDTDICLMSAGGAVSKEYSPKIGARGCVVMDDSSAWRLDPDVPLIVPEVNTLRRKDSARRTSSPTPTARRRNWWWH